MRATVLMAAKLREIDKVFPKTLDGISFSFLGECARSDMRVTSVTILVSVSILWRIDKNVSGIQIEVSLISFMEDRDNSTTFCLRNADSFAFYGCAHQDQSTTFSILDDR